MTNPDVRVEVSDRVMIITIDRPQARNAMTPEGAVIIENALDELDSRDDLTVAVITGAGGVFCAGADLKRLAAGEIAYGKRRGFAGIVAVPPRKPIIAAVEGFAMGGGFEITLACDLVVAADSATFALPEVKRGLAARAGGVVRLPRRIPRAIALEVLLTGTALTSSRAAGLGLVNHVVADGSALDRALELAQAIAANAPLAVAATKQVVVESESWPDAELFDRQKPILEPLFASKDAAEGAAAFAEKRAPRWTNS